MEELPNNLKEIFDNRFGSMNQFTCAICGTENINSVRLASHTKDCLNYFLIYSGNGPLNASSPKQDSQKKRKLDSEELEIVFPQQQGYYNNSPKQTKNFLEGKCSYEQCVAKKTGVSLERSVFVYCQAQFVHYCK